MPRRKTWKEETVHTEFTIRAESSKACRAKFELMYGDFWVCCSTKADPETINFPTGPPGLTRFKVKAKRKKKVSRLR